MAEMINSFRGKYYFLSNFYMAPVRYNGVTFTNNEAAFQAQKCRTASERAAFADLDPSSAKQRGRHVTLRTDWEKVKTDVMRDIVLAKFTQNPDLEAKLLVTGDTHLEEGNNWGDKIWGTVNGKGENRLGKILMEVRDILRNHEVGKDITME